MARGSGMTTSQINGAPRGAFYVVPSAGAIAYTNALAHHLGRSDLQIVSPGIFDGDGFRLRGRNSDIVIDHATELTNRQYDCWHQFKELAEARRKATSESL